MRKAYPLCFDSYPQYESWKEAARCSKPGASGYCTDCIVGYQRQMVELGRCNHPGTKFRIAKDGQIEGCRPEIKRVRIFFNGGQENVET